MAEIQATEDFQRALREAENYCYATNVGIIAPEHLLAGALKVLVAAGVAGLPAPGTLEAALLDVQGSSEDELSQQVMFGSAAREAMNQTAGDARRAGTEAISAAVLARGIITSGEVTPMFFGALGTTKAELLAALG